LTQGEIWTGDENQVDAVLRMLVDAHKPLRTGSGLWADSADKKIKGMLKGLKMEPRESMLRGAGTSGASISDPAKDEMRESRNAVEEAEEPVNPHKTTIPPHLHRPWHATYTGTDNAATEVPQVRYGTFIKKKASGDDLSNILELQLPPGADGKTRSRIRDARKSHRVKARFESARESAIDYRLFSAHAEEGDTAEIGDNGEFTGNRQHKGASVLGGQKGSASGLRAWAGLVEERIQRARESGFLKPTVGIGKPIPRDPEAGNPHIESGELLMNRIVKRQGALPPWIELQNNLDGALTAFRGTLRSTYTTHLVRNVMSSNTLIPLPPLHAIPAQDPVWEERERKFHDENVKQINDLVRRMNALAPSIARRGLVTRDLELQRAREGLQESVWAEIKARAELAASMPQRKDSPYLMESEGLAKLGRATKRSLWTIAHPVQAMKGGDRAYEGQEAGGGVGLLVFLAVGTGVLVVYTKRPAQNESAAPRPRKPASTADAPTTRPVASIELERPGWIRYYIIEPIATFFRFIHLAALFGPVILLSPMLLVGSTTPRPRRRRGDARSPKPEQVEENWGAVWWYGFLVRQMERAGPSFIKLGQWAASRADLFPKSLCDLMGKLHSNGDPHSLKHTKKAIEAAFDRPFDEVFEEFEEQPIGCGAIAQVR
jgi:aarF domain-containing kinase